MSASLSADRSLRTACSSSAASRTMARPHRAPRSRPTTAPSPNSTLRKDTRSVVGEPNSPIARRIAKTLTTANTSTEETQKNDAPPWFPEVEILQGGKNYTTFGFDPFSLVDQLGYHSYHL